ncbi:MAG: hypothetical protein LBB36_02050 [Fibromonadaceae bacterium]|jgi:hypothetical protein|nr:hypothetical protein [Fibromonadaceae bacterium]
MINLKNSSIEKFASYAQGKKVYAFGAGKYMRVFCEMFPEYNIEKTIFSFTDNDSDKWGKDYIVNEHAIPIVSIDDFVGNIGKNDIILISAYSYSDIVEQLNKIQKLDGIDCFILISISFANLPAKEIFTKIKRNNLWGSPESVSGPGSEIENTKSLVLELPKLFKSKNITSILDIPCGDFNWMKEMDLSAIDYLGADIVDELVLENQKKIWRQTAGRGYKNFITLNIVTDNLHKRDLIFTRDCFIHLSNSDIQKAIGNIKKSGSKYLMATTYVNHDYNCDIITGEFRPVNLQKEPFNFPEPECLLLENDAGKAMGLWEVGGM